jgi:hypothetical protein
VSIDLWGESNKGHTSGWSISRFWYWWLLDSSLKLHKVKFVRNKSNLVIKKGEVLPQ